MLEHALIKYGSALLFKKHHSLAATISKRQGCLDKRTAHHKAQLTNFSFTDDEESESSDNESPVTKTALPTRRGKFEDEEEEDDVSLPMHSLPTRPL